MFIGGWVSKPRCVISTLLSEQMDSLLDDAMRKGIKEDLATSRCKLSGS